jgi:tRNA threonylcarbamoyladenosine biosynthesis protein TsaE
MKLQINDLNALRPAAYQFVQAMQGRTVFAFYGKMGAGKTTFIKAVCEESQVDDVVNSPTFSIVNEYQTATNGNPVYHFDFYRINKLSEAVEIGLYDYLDSGCLCMMEWPENIEELLPEETLRVNITVNPDQTRTISWEDNK